MSDVANPDTIHGWMPRGWVAPCGEKMKAFSADRDLIDCPICRELDGQLDLPGIR